MTTTEAPPELELTCHCSGDADGHEPGLSTDGCAEGAVAERKIRPFKAGPTDQARSAKGTCPGCGKRLVVRRIKVTGHSPDTGPKGVPLGVEPRIGEHKTRDGVCPGGVPTELTFRVGTEVTGWETAHGADSVTRS